MLSTLSQHTLVRSPRSIPFPVRFQWQARGLRPFASRSSSSSSSVSKQAEPLSSQLIETYTFSKASALPPVNPASIRKSVPKSKETSPPPPPENCLLAELDKRGLLYDSTSRETLSQHIGSGKTTVYAGIDPSASSMHIGNLLPLMTLLHFARRGHTCLALIGGATGLVGDPSFRDDERKPMAENMVNENVDSISEQLQQFFQNANDYLERRGGQEEPCILPSVGEGQQSDSQLLLPSATMIIPQNHIDSNILDIRLVNNLSWTSGVSLLTFLSTVGRRVRVSAMLARDSVKSRMDRDQKGLSFTELSYQLLQAYDFLILQSNLACTIQIGGSDQLGNITAGIDLIRRVRRLKNMPAFGITVPLLTTSTGTKFGKSEGNAIWTSSKLLHDFEFYQFLLQSEDDRVEKYLKALTLLSLKEIDSIMDLHFENRSKRLAQTTLADQVTELVRGSEALKSSQLLTEIFFGTNPSKNIKIQDAFPTCPIVTETFQNVMVQTASKTFLQTVDVSRMFHEVGLADSRSLAKRFRHEGALRINLSSAKGRSQIPAKELERDFLVLKAGKKCRLILIDSSDQSQQEAAAVVVQENTLVDE